MPTVFAQAGGQAEWMLLLSAALPAFCSSGDQSYDMLPGFLIGIPDSGKSSFELLWNRLICRKLLYCINIKVCIFGYFLYG